MFQNSEYSLKYNLQFFAKEGAGGEKTEDPTAKKLRDARKEGQTPKSHELSTAVALLMLFLMLKLCVGYIGNGFLESFHEIYGMISSVVADPFEIVTLQRISLVTLQNIIMIMLPLLVSSFCVAFIIELVQVKWEVSGKPLQPKFSKLNPISGFKKIFSKDKLVELLKSIMKIGILSYVIYDALKDQWGMLLNMYQYTLQGAVYLIGTTVIDLGVKISIFFMAVAIFDVFYQKRKFKEDMKMTKQEVKDEYKQTEGDPQIKGQIRRKMQEASRRRMMQQLPEADVVITNPTHLAVAIKYDKDTSSAPVVLAKGADYLAQKIKDTAKEHQIEIVENKPLARMLYYNVEIGAEIPPELYQTVAEILAYVYGLQGKL